MGHRQQLLAPDDVRHIKLEQCSCGHKGFDNLQPFYTHQHKSDRRVSLATEALGDGHRRRGALYGAPEAIPGRLQKIGPPSWPR
jgi:hypothetical protein